MPSTFDYTQFLESSRNHFGRGLDQLAGVYLDRQRETRDRRQRLEDILSQRGYSDRVRSEEREFQLADEKRRNDSQWSYAERKSQLENKLRRDLLAEEDLNNSAKKLGVPVFDESGSYRNKSDIQKDFHAAAQARLSALNGEVKSLESREADVSDKLRRILNDDVDPVLQKKALAMTIDENAGLLSKLSNAKAIVEGAQRGTIKSDDIYKALASNTGVFKWQKSALDEAGQFRKAYLDKLAEVAGPSQKFQLAGLSQQLREIEEEKKINARERNKFLQENGQFLPKSVTKDLEFSGPPAPPRIDANGLAVMPVPTTPPVVTKTPVKLSGYSPELNAEDPVTDEDVRTLGGLSPFQLPVDRVVPMPSRLSQPITDAEVTAGKAARDARLSSQGIIPKAFPPPPGVAQPATPSIVGAPSRIQQAAQFADAIGSGDMNVLNAAGHLMMKERNMSEDDVRGMIEAAKAPDNLRAPELIQIIRSFVDRVKAPQ